MQFTSFIVSRSRDVGGELGKYQEKIKGYLDLLLVNTKNINSHKTKEIIRTQPIKGK